MLDVDIANAEAKRISCAVVDGIMDEEKGRVDVGSLSNFFLHPGDGLVFLANGVVHHSNEDQHNDTYRRAHV